MSGTTGRPLGRHQRLLLCVLGSPTMLAVVGTPRLRALARRSLLHPEGKDGDSLYRITPAGLRELARLLEAGALADLLALPGTSVMRPNEGEKA